MTILDLLLKTTKKSPSAAIEKAIAAGREQRAALEADRVRAAEARVAAVRVGDAKGKAKAASELAAIEDKIADLDILLADREADLVAARDIERRAGIDDRRKVAMEATAEAAAFILRRYGKLSAEMVAGLAIVARAEQAVVETNRDLPDDIEPLQAVERSLRGHPGSERRVISERRVVKWAFAESGAPLTEEQATKVIPAVGGRGILNAGTWNSNIHVRKRAFIERTFVEGVRAEWPAALATSVRLPGLRAGDPEVWGLSYGDDRPEAILDAIERSRAAAGRRPSEPQPLVELIPIGDEPVANENAASAA